jgi:uncharacterized RDD family membrane protein YckC
MFCSKCGASNVEGAGFCSACGQPIAGFSVGQPTAAPPSYGAAPASPAFGAAPAAVHYAGFWLRFVAIIIDGIVLWFVGLIVTLPFGIPMGMRGMFGRVPHDPEELARFYAALFPVMLLRLILNWLYFAFFESSSWQATLGKKALGLEVTDLADHRISFGRATGRFFGKILSWATLTIGFIMAGFTEKKQALHDILAGTLVIRKV